ncbi:MAG: hypothetical protein AJITA_00706 [Acetilactobacillus jinshanensis]
MSSVQYPEFKKTIVNELTKKAGIKPDDIYIHHYRHNTLIGIGQKPKLKTIVNINYDTKFLVSINMKYLRTKLEAPDQQKIVKATNGYMRTLWKSVNPPFNPHKGINDEGAIN